MRDFNNSSQFCNPGKVRKLFQDLVMEPNEVRVSVDGTSLRAFMTVLKRRHDGAERKVI